MQAPNHGQAFEMCRSECRASKFDVDKRQFPDPPQINFLRHSQVWIGACSRMVLLEIHIRQINLCQKEALLYYAMKMYASKELPLLVD